MAKKVTISTGDFTGDIGDIVITGATGPVALNGDIHVDVDEDDRGGRREIKGRGVTVVEGDNTGTISRRF